MTSFADLIQHSSGWLFVPSAILLGALHGLEPGHSKTMMAAFIVAIRGTVPQAALLGLSATLSHTAVVWVVALGGLYLGRGFSAETTEPYFQLLSAAVIIAVALWMLWRMWSEETRAKRQGHERDRGARHRIDTGHGVVALEVFEQGVPPRWRLYREGGQAWTANDVSVETERLGGKRQCFGFVAREGFLESNEEIPEPHEFMARLRLGHAEHSHDYDVAFVEHSHDHDHIHEGLHGLEVATRGHQDAHELAHANDIRRRFADRNVTTSQIALFGLSGGLIPCPAAVTVLMLCLQLKEIPLGATLVVSFSVGLAITLVAVGVAAALSVRHASAHWPWFQSIARRAPYFSSALMMAVGLYVGLQGVNGLL